MNFKVQARCICPRGRAKVSVVMAKPEERKITHPFLKEKLNGGLYRIASLLLARTVRGDDGIRLLWKWGRYMLILIAYDVSTETAEGKRQLKCQKVFGMGSVSKTPSLNAILIE